jgi:hypothetical protein
MPWSSKSPPSGFPTKALYNFLSSPIRATCTAHLVLRDLICLMISWDEYKIRSSSWTEPMQYFYYFEYIIVRTHLCIGHFGDVGKVQLSGYAVQAPRGIWVVAPNHSSPLHYMGVSG